jgi:hypothetical protein
LSRNWLTNCRILEACCGKGAKSRDRSVTFDIAQKGGTPLEPL